jgi:hypothetical protein
LKTRTDTQALRKYFAFKHVTCWTAKPFARYAVCFSQSSESWAVCTGEPREFTCLGKEVFKCEKDGEWYQFVLAELDFAEVTRCEERYISWKWYGKSDPLSYFELKRKFNAEKRLLLGSVLESSCDA